MNTLIKLFAIGWLFTSMVSPTFAVGDLSKQAPVEIGVILGDKNNAMSFTPSTIEFETGKLYKLVLENQGLTKHYFTSNGMASAVYTRKVQINDSDGKPMAEVKGSINEIEIYPGYKAEWWFVPVKAGVFGDLHCSISGHSEAGMLGKIIIK
ncbi:biphenyl 2,3-dioxygenase [Gammaproteobacteria bacterium 45_16_T64]|nr:biphenyl 2,3-dioxygenase [Gammaproteobacteria bacterium 45_16_T64]